MLGFSMGEGSEGSSHVLTQVSEVLRVKGLSVRLSEAWSYGGDEKHRELVCAKHRFDQNTSLGNLRRWGGKAYQRDLSSKSLLVFSAMCFL